MKTQLIALGLAFLSVSTWGQGTINFANNAPSGSISTNVYFASGPMAGAGNYSFGLYVSEFPSSSPTMLLGVGQNGAFPGLFDGGDIAAPFPVGTVLSFQVRGWSSYAGATYEQAYNNTITAVTPFALLGQSTVGFLTVPASGSVNIFGTGPGQVSGFQLTPVIPEPSSTVLVLTGTALFLAPLLRRRDRQKKS